MAFGDQDESDGDQILLPRHRRKHSDIQREQEEEAEVEEEEDVEDDEFFSVWTLRKYSATSLEVLTTAFKSHVVHVLLPLLNTMSFCSQDWKVIESGILALGAAAEGNREQVR
ncbi:hypothetical protein G6F68_015415 [Rhizopus microsporus]|nr:hypothetical protein G6F68_015415 [Rhizopus microsporus]